MKTILQHDEKDCGAACLAMIAKHYGYQQSINAFRNMTNTDQEGTSMHEIIRAAESLGFNADGLQGSFEELMNAVEQNDVQFPFIAHTMTSEGYYHFVVVSGLSKEKFDIFDPAKGKVHMSFKDFSRMWTGNIIAMIPNNNFKKQNVKKTCHLGFHSLLKGQMKKFAVIVIVSMIISLIGIMGAFAFQIVIDNSNEIMEEHSIEEGSHHHEHEIEFLTRSEFLNTFLEGITESVTHLDSRDITKIFVCLIGLYILATVIQYIRARLIISMSKVIDMRLIIPYFNKIMEMPLSTIQKRNTGDYLSRYNDASIIRNAISSASITMLIDTTLALGCGIILIFLSPQLALITALVVLLYIFIVLMNIRKIKTSNRYFMENSAIVQSFLKENIDGIESIKAINAEDRVKNNMKLKFDIYLKSAIKRSRIVMGQDTLASGIEIIGITVLLWVGFLLVTQGKLTLGTLITFYVLLGYIITPIKNLIEILPTIQSAYIAGDRLNDILEASVEESEGEDLLSVETINDWKASDISFHYGKQDFLLKDASFSFKKGDKVALVGKSGSGKTTMAKLFARLLEPETGSIFVNGVPLTWYSKKSVRETVAYVGGDASLFSGTILENLKMANSECSEDEISRIIDYTKLSKLIDNLPGGLQFHIEQGGLNLSKGQRQRISILRALIKNPKLLVLDEATSNMDAETERELIDSIMSYFKDITIITVTHNLSSIKDYDKIYVLENGKITLASNQ